jgi:hypothetical protein
MEHWLLIAGWLVAGLVAAFAAIAIHHYRRVVREQDFVIEQLLPRRAVHSPALVAEETPSARVPLAACRIVPFDPRRAAEREPQPQWPICQ